MKVLLDRDLTPKLGRLLPGHPVQTADSRGWATPQKGQPCQNTESSGLDVLIAGDKNAIPQHNTARQGMFYASSRFYHGTNAETAEHIREHGFGTATRIGGIERSPGTMNLTFITPSKETARWFAENSTHGGSYGEAVKYGGPVVLQVAFSGSILSPQGCTSVWDVAEDFGLPYGPQGFEVKDLRDALSDRGYDAIRFKDPNANGRAAIAVFFPEKLTLINYKQAYLSPKDAELTVTLDYASRPQATILLDLGIPHFTVFSIRFPIEEILPVDLPGYVEDALEALLDEIAATMLSLRYSEDQAVLIQASAREAFRSIELDDASDAGMSNPDEALRMYETTFPISPEFVDATHALVVTAKVVRRSPERREIVLKPLRTQERANSPARIIQLYRNRSLRSLPRPHYVLIYDRQGRGVGAAPLARDWQSRLIHK